MAIIKTVSNSPLALNLAVLPAASMTATAGAPMQPGGTPASGFQLLYQGSLQAQEGQQPASVDGKPLPPEGEALPEEAALVDAQVEPGVQQASAEHPAPLLADGHWSLPAPSIKGIAADADGKPIVPAAATAPLPTDEAARAAGVATPTRSAGTAAAPVVTPPPSPANVLPAQNDIAAQMAASVQSSALTQTQNAAQVQAQAQATLAAAGHRGEAVPPIAVPAGGTDKPGSNNKPGTPAQVLPATSAASPGSATVSAAELDASLKAGTAAAGVSDTAGASGVAVAASSVSTTGVAAGTTGVMPQTSEGVSTVAMAASAAPAASTVAGDSPSVGTPAGLPAPSVEASKAGAVDMDAVRGTLAAADKAAAEVTVVREGATASLPTRPDSGVPRPAMEGAAGNARMEGGAQAVQAIAAATTEGGDTSSDTGQQQRQDGQQASLSNSASSRPLSGTAPAASPAAFALQQQLAEPRWSQQLGERAVMMAQHGPRVAHIQLDPPELGAMQIRIHMQGADQVSVSFTSAHPMVRDALEQQMPRLREMFADQGLNLQDSSVADEARQQGSDQRERADEQGRAGHYAGTADGNASEAPAAAIALGLVDYYA
ncbi:flagellar hook-length control protein FliK [Marinobacterium halophilum]|uniref:Flagellar hook-length control protein FliK n=1 Tax=Marinobacterium halophilum TaxID=267374 RepID=A0A2P8ESA2_9GAMM|nr:flagellar hook-length control protein FliK [Marinobacterium halophilum]PSL12367.1 flagellar hook-length control protein FliK [Marinobacterium halophilum]